MTKSLFISLFFAMNTGFADICPSTELNPPQYPWVINPVSSPPSDLSNLQWIKTTLLSYGGVTCTYLNAKDEKYSIFMFGKAVPVDRGHWFNELGGKSCISKNAGACAFDLDSK